MLCTFEIQKNEYVRMCQSIYYIGVINAGWRPLNYHWSEWMKNLGFEMVYSKSGPLLYVICLRYVPNTEIILNLMILYHVYTQKNIELKEEVLTFDHGKFP